MEDTIFTTAQALAFLEGSDNHQPGKLAASVLIPDQPAAQYHADRAVLSCSMLKPLLVSPAHFQVAQVAGQGQQLGLETGLRPRP